MIFFRSGGMRKALIVYFWIGSCLLLYGIYYFTWWGLLGWFQVLVLDWLSGLYNLHILGDNFVWRRTHRFFKTHLKKILYVHSLSLTCSSQKEKDKYRRQLCHMARQTHIQSLNDIGLKEIIFNFSRPITDK